MSECPCRGGCPNCECRNKPVPTVDNLVYLRHWRPEGRSVARSDLPRRLVKKGDAYQIEVARIIRMEVK